MEKKSIIEEAPQPPTKKCLNCFGTGTLFSYARKSGKIIPRTCPVCKGFRRIPCTPEEASE